MKTNLKQGNAIVRFLLGHGEKLGIAALGICTAMVIWSALGRERLEKQPSELAQLTTQARSHVASFTWKALAEQEYSPDEESPIVKAESQLTDPMKEVLASSFPNYRQSFNPAVTDPVMPRRDPVLLAPIDLEVNADSGLWASSNPALIRDKAIELAKEQARQDRDDAEASEKSRRDGKDSGPARNNLYSRGGPGASERNPGKVAKNRTSKDAPIVLRPQSGAQLQGYEEIQGKSWVTVLAKVPIEQQTQQFIDALRSSRGYNEAADIPEYLGYQVDRAEVTSEGLGEWKKVVFNYNKTLLAEIETYPVNVPDVIDTDVEHSLLTHPLPPLILKDWGIRVSHSSMPLASEKAEAASDALEQPEKEEDQPEGEMSEEDLFARSSTQREDNRSLAGRVDRGRPRSPEAAYGRPPMNSGRPPSRGGGAYGGDIGRSGRMSRGGGYGTPGKGSQTTLAQFVWDGKTPYLLFRYFDKTAQPGRSYRYRVRLNMRDVNHKTASQHLDDSVRQRREKEGNKFFRWTDWSKPSPVASVPLLARIFLVSAEPARESNFNAEPEADILIKSFDSEYAAEVARQDSFKRGSVINVVEKAAVIWANRFDALETPSFKFQTGITVLDFTGGKRLSTRNKDLVTPTRALLMDAAGHLFVQEEMNDLETVAKYQEAITAGAGDRGPGSGRDGYGRDGGTGRDGPPTGGRY